MAGNVGAEPASCSGKGSDDEEPLCLRDLKMEVLGKKICSVCNWYEWNEEHQDWDVCDLVIGVIDAGPLTELIYYLYGPDLDELPITYIHIDKLALDTLKRAIEAMVNTILVRLGLGSMRVKVVHKINDDLPQFAVKDVSKVDKNQLLFKSPKDIMRFGVYFSASDEFDEDEYVAFNNLVRYALTTGSIKAILFFEHVFPYDPYGDYYWAIIYNQDAEEVMGHE
jgi:hypothetical protein